MRQHTLSKSYVFEGKGLHTGQIARMTVSPAPADTGIRFRRIDVGEDAWISARADAVTSTARSTRLSGPCGDVNTVEHILSALTGMGIDNAVIDIDNIEVPILDGSARPYAVAFREAGIVPQEAPRRFLTLDHEVEVRDEKTGSWVKVTPAPAPAYDVTIDFGSRVLGVQQAHWDFSLDYAVEIAPCRTFVFFHEIEFLFANNLIKGGDLDNALVLAEHPVPEESLEKMSALFGKPKLKINENGYLNDVVLHFPNECGRHKWLDMMGDLRLAGGYLNAVVTGYKPGHGINTVAAKAVREALKK
jgi:UDP-3-O-[3-hydroxymyristoyl] N-acetylglucosamine deacetylase/3-hydroxyacyl-[acyl-carrier-protein] dehydratase